jgi:hypothetical protein
MPLMTYHLLREVQETREGPVTQAQVEAHAREVLPLAEHNVQTGLERLAGAGLVNRFTVDKFTEEEREVWSARGDARVEVVAAQHPDLYRESFWYFLISQRAGGRPLPPRKVIRILREVSGDSAKAPEVHEVLRNLETRAT